MQNSSRYSFFEEEFDGIMPVEIVVENTKRKKMEYLKGSHIKKFEW